MKYVFRLILIVFVAGAILSGCKKDSTGPTYTSPLKGIWEATADYPLPGGGNYHLYIILNLDESGGNISGTGKFYNGSDTTNLTTTGVFKTPQVTLTFSNLIGGSYNGQLNLSNASITGNLSMSTSDPTKYPLNFVEKK